VSVPLEGWSHAQAISRIADVHLVTQIRNREAILRAGLVEGEQFTSIDSERITRPTYKIASLLRGGPGKGWTTLTALMSLAYPYFEWLIWRRFGAAIRTRQYDVVHRLTPLSPTAPSLLAGKCRRAGVPFIVGPLNGGVPWPKGFDAARRQEREWLSYIRGIYQLLPGIRATRRNASALLIGSHDTWDQTPAKYHHKCIYVPENAIDPTRFRTLRTRAAARPLKVVFVGRLVPYKGADMLLEAAAPLIRSGDVQVTIIGDGPQMPELRSLVAREILTENVRFTGWVKHGEIQTILANMDVLGFPSIREFGGAVVLEAMAVGVVPIIVNYGGPAELVTLDTGFAVAMGTRSQIVQRFRAILTQLVSSPETIDRMSARAIDHVRNNFTWDAKAGAVLEVYKWLMNPNLPIPAFPRPFRGTGESATTPQIYSEPGSGT
jgi:glycosyltransferase involved in cell wall biosynthesis